MKLTAFKGCTAYEAQLQFKRGGVAMSLIRSHYAVRGNPLLTVYRTTEDNSVGPTLLRLEIASLPEPLIRILQRLASARIRRA